MQGVKRPCSRGGKPFGAEETFGDGERLWGPTAALGKLLAGKGATVLDATLPGFDYKKELGTSRAQSDPARAWSWIVSNATRPGTRARAHEADSKAPRRRTRSSLYYIGSRF